MKNRNCWIMPDALPLVLAGVILAVGLYYLLGIYGAVLPAVFVLFTLYFFRNPSRTAQVDSQDLLAPADGRVLCVEEVTEDRFLKGPAIKVSIFLNIFNVHVNRAPIESTVEYVHYQPGKFLPAFKGHASQINERNYVGLRVNHSKTALLVVQITGFIARRVVCWVKEGERLLSGARFGLIKFGSCTEVYLPIGTDIFVEKGQKVKGGQTIIGRLKHE